MAPDSDSHHDTLARNLQTRARFVDLYIKDLQDGRRRSRSEYQGLFPGHEDLVARLHEDVLRDGATGAELDPGQSRPRDGDQKRPIAHGLDDDRLGPYRILEELGRGGQGVVYKAEDTRLRRKVALKILTAIGPGSEELVRRFRREAEIASRLEHPGICGVHDAGVADGIPYIAMQFVPGETLAQRLNASRRSRLAAQPSSVILFSEPIEPSARGSGEEKADTAVRGTTSSMTKREISDILCVFEKAARALHAAHEAGVIHRDIKPANIMLSPSGEPVILDFGLARSEDPDQQTLTLTGDLFGTPAYMSPEQLMGNRIRLDRRSDVYSLGATLYECLTLKKPFEGPTRETLYQNIMTRVASDPRQLNPAISRDLGTVIEKTLEKDRDHRYETALEFAEELRRVREYEPIHAKPVARWVRVKRWAQRNPVVAASLAGVFLILVLGLLATWIQKERADENAKEALTNAQNARRNLLEFERLADARRLSDLVRESEEELWPATPARILALEAWLARARELGMRLEEHRKARDVLRMLALPWSAEERAQDRASHIAELEKLADFEAAMDRAKGKLWELGRYAMPEERKEQLRERLEEELALAEENLRTARTRLEPVLSDRATYAFDDPTGTLAWRHERLSELVRGLEAFVGNDSKKPGLRSVEERLERVRSLDQRLRGEDAPTWSACLARIGKNSQYPPGTLTHPQHGILPLGPDPDSGLEEFSVLGTGEPPVRDPSTGRLPPTGEGTSIVLVLLPGATFKMGAQGQLATKPNFDPGFCLEESPVHDVTLSSYFLSKHEMTQGQWLRTTGENPSFHIGTPCLCGHIFDSRYPVEQMDRMSCRRALARLGLVLPTEAQWEAACRAGKGMPWSTGKEAASLLGYANLAGEEHRLHFRAVMEFEADFMDEWPHVAPVGSLYPNAFGLYDMHGNVEELCEDQYGLYEGSTLRAVDGLRIIPGAVRSAVSRGGSFLKPAALTRSAARDRLDPSNRDYNRGVRPARGITTE